MVVESIETIKPGKLYALKYRGFETNELSRLFDKWMQVDFLDDFFTEHTEDLYRGFYPTEKIENATSDSILEARALSSTIRQNIDDLNVLFKPLSEEDEKDDFHLRCKAKGNRSKSWLRIYGINLGEGCIVITGGAIKLTRKMRDRAHTKLEIQKLKIAKQYLLDKEFIDHIDIENWELGI